MDNKVFELNSYVTMQKKGYFLQRKMLQRSKCLIARNTMGKG